MTKAVAANPKKETKESLKLPKFMADLKANDHLLAEVVKVFLANGRQSTKKTKTRGEVSGGGKKPWRQKGTGRARTGSIRNPIWRGGGIIFGPTGEENYKINLPQRKKQLALALAIKSKFDKNEVAVIADLKVKNIKTKDVLKTLEPTCKDKKTLVVTSEKDEILQKSIRNVANIDLAIARDLNVFNVLNNEIICFEKAALDQLFKKLSERIEK